MQKFQAEAFDILTEEETNSTVRVAIIANRGSTRQTIYKQKRGT